MDVTKTIEMIHKGGMPALGIVFLLMMQGVKTDVAKMTESITTLNVSMAQVVEKNIHTTSTVERAERDIGNLDSRVRSLEVNK